ncbi:MAG: hypothetical protein HC835_10395 [Oscillatoriales cyanobacterium RM2_1_1]|nr:hypothetical protein [Oscillatoriales cyanobacterium SM2_3_0]NJO45998.1 hypothetical protein [Oscillatoriales cyanobacterium RM2_1_1]
MGEGFVWLEVPKGSPGLQLQQVSKLILELIATGSGKLISTLKWNGEHPPFRPQVDPRSLSESRHVRFRSEQSYSQSSDRY